MSHVGKCAELYLKKYKVDGLTRSESSTRRPGPDPVEGPVNNAHPAVTKLGEDFVTLTAIISPQLDVSGCVP